MRDTPSRRAMLAGLAAAPVAGLPVAASAFAADPALDALREYDRIHAIEQAAWKASSEAYAIARAATPQRNDVYFNGQRVFGLDHLDVLRELSMGVTDEELEETILRLRKEAVKKRAESANLEPEYQRARASLEDREAIPLARDAAAVIDAEARAGEACDDTHEAQKAVFKSEPATPAGAIAQLRFIAKFVDEPGLINDTSADGILGDTIRRAVACLDGGRSHEQL